MNSTLSDYDLQDLGHEVSASINNSYSTYNSTYNGTYSCIAENMHDSIKSYLSIVTSATFRSIIGLINIAILLLGTPLNSWVIALIIKHRKLQTLSFAIGAQIVIIDLFLSLLVSLTSISNIISNQWLFGEHGCIFYGYLMFAASFIRTLLLFIFVGDRFFSVFIPFWYPKYRKKIIIFFSVVSWVLPTVCGGPILPPLLDCITYYPSVWTCNVSTYSCGGYCSYYINSLYTIIVLPTSLLSILLYSFLFCKAKKIHHSDTVATGTSNDNYRRERRANITFLLMFIAVIAVSFLKIALSLIKSVVFGENVSVLSFIITSFSFSIGLLLTILDPIIIMRNKDVRDLLPEFIKRCYSGQDEDDGDCGEGEGVGREGEEGEGREGEEGEGREGKEGEGREGEEGEDREDEESEGEDSGEDEGEQDE